MYRHCESFDNLALADLGLKYLAVNLSGAFQAGRTGNCHRPTNPGSLTLTLDTQPTWIVGLAIWVASTAGADLIILKDAGVTQFVLTINSNQTISVKRGSTVIGTSTAQIRTGVWEYLELKVTISNTGSYEVRLNSANILSAAGVDTSQTANQSANAVTVTTVGTWLYDDWYIFDGQGSTQNDFAGDPRVYSVLPDAAGNYSQFTPTGAASNYQAVDEATQDGDTSYAASSTAGQKDSYSLAAVPTGLNVLGATLTLFMRKDDAGARTVRPLARVSAADYFGSNISLSNSYVGYLAQFADNPAGGAWTPAALNAAEFGLEIVS